MSGFLGCDPGAGGAFALFDPVTRHLEVADMPTVVVTVNGKRRNRIDVYALGDLMRSWAPHCTHATIEEVNSTPNDGHIQAFSFGGAFYAAQQAVASEQIPMYLCRPQEWKQRFKLIGHDKDESRLRASQLLPEHALKWNLKKHDGRAEAVLLAIYGAMLKGAYK